MKKGFVLVLLAIGLTLVSCSQRKVVQPEQQQPMVPSQETREKAAEVKPEEKVIEQRFAKIETKEELSKYIEEKDLLEDINFDYDKYDIRTDAKPILQRIASSLLKDVSVKILVEGYCDERGTNEYNLALGDRRAKAARDYLIALGTASDRIEMLSYGEEKPLCTEETDECWAKNRRAHFVILKERGK